MVSALLPLRAYQSAAIEAIEKWFKADPGVNLRCAVVLPTGGGKTVVFSHYAKHILDACPDKRVVVLVHTDELVRQAVKKIKDVAPHLEVGVVKAKENGVTADVIVASVQSLRAPARLAQIRDVALVIVDECHHAVARSYMTILDHFGAFRPGGTRVVGFTATLVRGDDKSLTKVWQHVPFSRDISWMVRKGFLIEPRGKAVEVPDLDLRNVKSTRKDFREGELGEALAESLAPELVAKAYAEHAADRRGILFAPTVNSASVFAESFEDIGISCEVVHGGLPQDQRDAILQRHRSGITQVVANCMVLTEGYDDPEVSCIVVARPTKSKGLYIQMVGRGLRVNPSREWSDQDCLILDVVGANALHDLRSVIDLSEKPIPQKRENDGRSLTELEDEFDAGEGVEIDEPEFYHGPVEVVDFDPLGNKTSRVWIKSDDGNYFLPAGTSAYVFIFEYPGPGRWSVAWCAKDARNPLFFCEVDKIGLTRFCHPQCKKRRSVALTNHADLSLESAMSWAEDLAVDMGADTLNLANKKAAWRSKPASQKMKDLAARLNVAERPGDNAGKLSDRITRVTGSRTVDPLVRKAQRRQSK